MKTYIVTFFKKDNSHLIEIKIKHYTEESTKEYCMGILGISESKIKNIKEIKR